MLSGIVFTSLLSVGLAPPPQLLSGLPILYDTALATNPIATRVTTAAVLAASGDALAQARARRARASKQIPCDGVARHDMSRTAAFVGVEAVYRGLLQQRIFQWIIATFSGDWISVLAPWCSPIACAAIERVLFNMFVISTGVYYPLFFSVTATVQRLTWLQAVRRAKTEFPRLFGVNLLFWVPVQLVQFAFVPLRYKVPFICVAGFVWNMLLSALAGSVARWREVGGPLSGDEGRTAAADGGAAADAGDTVALEATATNPHGYVRPAGTGVAGKAHVEEPSHEELLQEAPVEASEAGEDANAAAMKS